LVFRIESKNDGYLEYSRMRELNVNEIEQVNGGLHPDALWAGSLGVSMSFFVMAIGGAAALTPFGMGAMLAASILSSAVAISTQVDVTQRPETP